MTKGKFMITRNLLYSALAGAALLAGSPAKAADPVGTVERVVVYAYGTAPSQARQPVYKFDKVIFGERLETVEKGSLKIAFIDNTTLFLGSKSNLVIDSYLFDPASAKESLVLKASTGAFRFVTGTISKTAVSIQTPVAQIGIRGTDFSMSVEENGKTVIAVDSGAIEVSTAQSTTPTVVDAGDVANISPDGSVSLGALSEAPNDIGLTEAGSTDGNAPSDGDSPGSSSSSSSSSSDT